MSVELPPDEAAFPGFVSEWGTIRRCFDEAAGKTSLNELEKTT